MIIEAVYRRFVPLKAGKGPLDVRSTQQESLAVAQVEPPGFELSRAGRRFFLAYNGTVPTGIAPVQAFPTTAAQWAIFNNDVAKTYFFNTLGMMVFSGTTGVGGTLLACIFNLPTQTGFATGLGVASASFSAIGSKAAIKSGVTITAPAAPVWFPVSEQLSGVAGVGPASSIMNRSSEGRIAIPPATGLGLAVLAPAGTTPLYLPVAEWIELEADLE